MIDEVDADGCGPWTPDPRGGRTLETGFRENVSIIVFGLGGGETPVFVWEMFAVGLGKLWPFV